ncbi:CPBP family intramembrane glutamic endopeptidase [Nakamurella flava]|uniref:CPBP family intramembrane glutamic endopeptidase n=1 Tax=Nakamurella flava TaxID=2576308 RepID=UPI00140E1A2A|nr:CPBP family intramembrane glutamic endopeptidase [Nakamurella flava]
MRIRPSWRPAVAVFALYLVVVVALWTAIGMDYTAFAGTTRTVALGMTLTMGVLVALLVVVTSVLGWWRPVLRERATGPRWLLVLPVLYVLTAVGPLLSVDLGRVPPGYWVALALGCLGVGVAEELLCRGLLLVGFRGSVGEVGAWLGATLLFSLLHAVNAFFGQSLGTTAFQLAATFLAGTAFYVMRRVSGGLLLPVLVHAFFDFGLIAGEGMGTKGSPWNALTNLQLLAWVVAVVGTVLVLRASRRAAVAPPLGADGPVVAA